MAAWVSTGLETPVLEKLTSEAGAEALARLHGWREVEGRDAIAKSFTFNSFNEASVCMTRAALKAEQMKPSSRMVQRLHTR